MPKKFTNDEEKRKYYQELGRKGGRANVRKNGRAHMSRIGKKGYEATTKRHFQGSRALHGRWLSECGLYHVVKSTGLPMKFTVDGSPVWPAEEPVHPSKSDAPWF